METEKVVFMGRITAGVTHEIKNVLAIIKESAGLLEDLILLSKEKGIPQPAEEKFLSTLTRIAEQVSRGVDLATNLNAFAHTAEERIANVDLNRAVENVAILSARFVRLKRMTVRSVPCDGSAVITTDPMGFQMLLFQAVEFMLGLVEEGAVISLKPVGDERARVLISADGNPIRPAALADQMENSQRKAMETSARALDLSVRIGGPPLWVSVG